MDVFRSLLHDASRPDQPGTAAHRALLERADGWAVGPMVVGDERLAGLDGDVGVSVLTSGGAGSVAALAPPRADPPPLAVETLPRDPGDPARNASRGVAAADDPPPGGAGFVGLP